MVENIIEVLNIEVAGFEPVRIIKRIVFF